MSLTLAILDLQARLRSLETKLEELQRQTARAPKKAETAGDARKPKRKRKCK